MSLIDFSIQHGRTIEDARDKLRSAAVQVQSSFPAFVQRVDTSADGTSAKLVGRGFEISLRVDATHLYATGNIALLDNLIGRTFVAGLKHIVKQKFRRRLT